MYFELRFLVSPDTIRVEQVETQHSQHLKIEFHFSPTFLIDCQLDLVNIMILTIFLDLYLAKPHWQCDGEL